MLKKGNNHIRLTFFKKISQKYFLILESIIKQGFDFSMNNSGQIESLLDLPDRKFLRSERKCPKKVRIQLMDFILGKQKHQQDFEIFVHVIAILF